MEELSVALNAVVPLFLMMMIGYYSRKRNYLNEETVGHMNTFTFHFLFPALIFQNIYKADVSGGIPFKLVGYGIAGLVIFMSLMILLYGLTEKRTDRKGVLVQGSFRSNFVLFAIPIATAIYGENGLGVLPVSIAIIVPTINILSVISLEIFRGGRIDLKQIGKGILANPMIRGAIVAFILASCSIRIPLFLETAIGNLSKATTAVALIMLGATFRFDSLKENIRPVAKGVFCKLILFPVIFVTLGVILGYRNIELLTLVVLFSAPTAIASYAMATQMGGDGELAAELIVVSSLLSIATLFVWIYTLKCFAFI